jgi:hypothetical protein
MRWSQIVVTLWCLTAASSSTFADSAASGPGPGRSEAAGLVLGIDGTSFTLNGRKTFLLGASYYGALGAPDDFIARDLDDLKALGFNWIRVWAVWDAFDNNVSAVDTAGNAREPYLSKLKAVVTAAATRGMLVDVTLARMLCLPNQEAHLRAAETLAKALKGFRNVYFDLANERDQHYENVFVSYAELRALRDRVKAADPDRLVTASGAPADREDLSRYLAEAGLDFICPHLDRDAGTEQKTTDATRKYLGWMKELGRAVPIHYQEPFRRDYLDYRGFWQPEVETFCTDLRNAKLGGAAGWCFHNGSPSPPERYPAGKRRSFDMRPSQGVMTNSTRSSAVPEARPRAQVELNAVAILHAPAIQEGDIPAMGVARCPPVRRAWTRSTRITVVRYSNGVTTGLREGRRMQRVGRAVRTSTAFPAKSDGGRLPRVLPQSDGGHDDAGPDEQPGGSARLAAGSAQRSLGPRPRASQGGDPVCDGAVFQRAERVSEGLQFHLVAQGGPGTDRPMAHDDQVW